MLYTTVTVKHFACVGFFCLYVHLAPHQHKGINTIVLRILQIPLIRQFSKAQVKYSKYLERLSAR